MRAGTLAFALGICLSLRIPFLPAFISPFSCAGACLLGLLCYRKLPLFACWLIGLAWGLWHLDRLEQNLLPANLEQRDIWLNGTVAGLPRDSERARRVDFHSQHWCHSDLVADCDHEQRWQSATWKVLLNDFQALGLQPGQQAKLQVRLKRPRGFANPGTFDYEAWLWAQGYQATGYVRNNEANQILSTTVSVDSVRFGLRERLQALFQESPMSQQGILLALGLGDHQGLDDHDWTLFSATGTNHLMVISGLHIGLMATLGYQFCLLLWRWVPGLPLYWPAPRAAAIAAILMALAYCLLAGFSLPTQRAFVMVLAFMGSRLLLRQNNSRNGLGVSLVSVLLLNPMGPVSAGFWLSFGAVAVLLYCAMPAETETGNRVSDYLKAALKAQWALFFALMPLLLLYFQQLSLLAPAVNLLAIPLVGFLVVPLTLCGLFLLYCWQDAARLCLWLANRLLEGFMWMLDWVVATFPSLLVHQAWPGGFTALCLAAVILTVLFAPYLWLRIVAACSIPLLLLRQPEPPPHGTLILHMLDVGQGMALVLESSDSVLVYDAGPRFSPRFDAGSAILQPFLRNQGLVPDRFIISHGDNDHAGGLPSLRQAWPDVPVISGQTERLSSPAIPCEAGQAWQSSGLTFRFLHPPAQSTGLSSNDSSCVLMVAGAWGRVLLTSDIEAVGERMIMRAEGEQLQADVITVPHHGSSTSSTPGFLNRLAAHTALVSSGYLNHFGHPRENIVARYELRDIKLWNTADSGYLRLTLGMDSSPQPIAYRVESPRVWRLQ